MSTLVDAPATLRDQRASSSRLPRHTQSPLIADGVETQDATRSVRTRTALNRQMQVGVKELQ